MRKVISTALMLFMSISLVLTGCGGGGTATSTDSKTTENAKETTENAAGETPAKGAVPAEKEETNSNDLMMKKTNLSGEITVWTFVGLEDIAKEFMKQSPNIKVNVVKMGMEMHDKLATTLAAGSGAPDVAIVEQGHFPRYVTGDVLEDLLQQPFDAGKYEDYVSDYNWNRWKSVDGMKQYGFPWDVAPGVFFYRADIYEQLGLPSDPAELAEYMQDPENVFTIAQTLKADGKYFMEWGDGPVHWGGDEVGYFDTNLNWTRDSDRLVELLDVTKRGEQIKWSPYKSIWGNEGKAMLKKGELTGVVLGNWGAGTLNNFVPEQKGKWRATAMPFGVHTGIGGSTFVIPKQSKNKEAAWAFVEWANVSEDAWKIWHDGGTLSGWKHIQEKDWFQKHSDPFLGGQEDFKLYLELEKQIPKRTLNPLDGKAWPIWVEGVQKAIKKNLDSKAILQEIQDNIQNKLKPDIEKMKKELGK
ncbi:extracellular solute-binding protein [Paenibacillus sp. sptzw28]|uniref:ABC transporter substrate-binding protein n=1 Tax=Paenibacillus sp. sptzw28 TaxID=715179 RepID=UPI001C6F1FCA|nr:extracellular solute-binding protein [Paenibacillus sp. sptzw28]QYR20774.1 extracellular solute-binding protein [Paenibacillus sp. sptzw28]